MENKLQGTNGHSASPARGFLHDASDDLEGSQQFHGMPFTPMISPRLVALFEQNSLGAERFRMLAGRLQYFQKQRGLKRIAITSAIPGEGKSLVSANLAISLARTQKTLLIDGDLHKSGLKDLLGTQHARGLTEWWEGARTIGDFLLRVENTLLWHLPAGHVMGQPLEILQSQRMTQTLLELSESFEWLIIDSPPLVPISDGHVWATHADGTLLVARQGTTPKKLVQSVLENSGNLKLLGAVMNAAEEPRQQYYYSSYYRDEPRGRGRREKAASKPAAQTQAWPSSHK